MQWVVVVMAWLTGTVWGDLYEMPAAQNSNQDATVFALVVSFTTPCMPFAALMELLQYGYPLTAYVNLALSIANRSGGFVTNTFYHQTELATSNFTDINRPNVDTYVFHVSLHDLANISNFSLYSEALVDLSQEDLVVTLPPMPDDRFFVFPFYDL